MGLRSGCESAREQADAPAQSIRIAIRRIISRVPGFYCAGPSTAVTERIRTETAKWRALVAKTGIKPE